MERPRQLQSGKWQGRVTGPDGKRYSAGVHVSERKAEKAQALKLAELEARQEAGPDPDKTDFVQYAEAYLYSRRPEEVDGLAPTSYYKNQKWLQGKLVPFFAGKAVQDITPPMVRDWWNKHSEAPSTRKSAYYLLNAIFELALDDELISRNPCRVKGAGKKVSKTRPTFTEADVAKLYEAADDTQTKALVALLAGSAMRVGEAVALRWDDVSFWDARVHVQRHRTPQGLPEGTKAGEDKTRLLALPGWVTEALEALYKERDGEGFIFLNKRGTGLSVDGAERIFRDLREEAGLPHIHLHDLRHVSLTAYANQPGVTLRDVMARGGHSSEKVAMGYQHTTTEKDEAVAKALPNPLVRK